MLTKGPPGVERAAVTRRRRRWSPTRPPRRDAQPVKGHRFHVPVNAGRPAPGRRRLDGSTVRRRNSNRVKESASVSAWKASSLNQATSRLSRSIASRAISRVASVRARRGHEAVQAARGVDEKLRRGPAPDAQRAVRGVLHLLERRLAERRVRRVGHGSGFGIRREFCHRHVKYVTIGRRCQESARGMAAAARGLYRGWPCLWNWERSGRRRCSVPSVGKGRSDAGTPTRRR